MPFNVFYVFCGFGCWMNFKMGGPFQITRFFNSLSLFVVGKSVVFDMIRQNSINTGRVRADF